MKPLSLDAQLAAAKSNYDLAIARGDDREAGQAYRTMRDLRHKIMRRDKRRRAGEFARDMAGAFFAPFIVGCVGIVSLADERAEAQTALRPAALGSNAIDPMTVILVALLSIIAVEAIMFIIAKISMTARRIYPDDVYPDPDKGESL